MTNAMSVSPRRPSPNGKAQQRRDARRGAARPESVETTETPRRLLQLLVRRHLTARSPHSFGDLLSAECSCNAYLMQPDASISVEHIHPMPERLIGEHRWQPSKFLRNPVMCEAMRNHPHGPVLFFWYDVLHAQSKQKLNGALVVGHREDCQIVPVELEAPFVIRDPAFSRIRRPENRIHGRLHAPR